MNVDGVESFTAGRLELARARRGMTQRSLAEAIGLSPRMVRAYEAGDAVPAAGTLVAIGRALSFPPSFFQAAPVDPLTLDAVSFRALTKASASLRSRAVAAGTIAIELHAFIAQRFVLPSAQLPDLRFATPSVAAEQVRQAWGLGQRPLAHLIRLVEHHGVRVFSLCEDCDAIDAFSLWRDGVPFMFLNTRKTAERSIFDVAHELGHLVMHRHGEPSGRSAEAEADAFAASFLLPEHAIRASAPRFPTLASIIAMKQTWRASAAALGYRLRDLGLMTEWQYRGFNIELSKRGRANEPAPLEREVSVALRKVLLALASDGIGIRDIARALHVSPSEIRALCFQPHAIEGG